MTKHLAEQAGSVQILLNVTIGNRFLKEQSYLPALKMTEFILIENCIKIPSATAENVFHSPFSLIYILSHACFVFFSRNVANLYIFPLSYFLFFFVIYGFQI